VPAQQQLEVRPRAGSIERVRDDCGMGPGGFGEDGGKPQRNPSPRWKKLRIGMLRGLLRTTSGLTQEELWAEVTDYCNAVVDGLSAGIVQ